MTNLPPTNNILSKLLGVEEGVDWFSSFLPDLIITLPSVPRQSCGDRSGQVEVDTGEVGVKEVKTEACDL